MQQKLGSTLVGAIHVFVQNLVHIDLMIADGRALITLNDLMDSD